MSPTKFSREEEISPKWRHVTCSALDTPLPNLGKDQHTAKTQPILLQKACCFKIHCRPCACDFEGRVLELSSWLSQARESKGLIAPSSLAIIIDEAKLDSTTILSTCSSATDHICIHTSPTIDPLGVTR